MTEKKRSPIRNLFKYRNHYDMVSPTVEILRNDGVRTVYELLTSNNELTGQEYLNPLARGAKDADLPWSCGYICHMFHYHHPWTHRGYLSSKSAADKLAELFVKGQNLWTLGSKDRAVYQLGRMLHLIQDIFIPHHAAVTAIRGHGQLEQWLDDRWKDYIVMQNGHYSWEESFECTQRGRIHTVSSKNPYDWVDMGSHISYAWYRKHFLGSESIPNAFPQLASKIIPFALRYSAGFIKRFFVGLTV